MVNGLVVVVLLAAPGGVDGGLSLAEVSDVVALHGPDLGGCPSVKKGQPARFVVGEDGGVLEATGPREAGCFLEQLRGWAFPPRTPATQVTWQWAGPRGALKVVAAGEEGGLTASAVLEAQRVHAAEAAGCYVAHRRRPTHEGSFDTEVLIGPSGAVLEASAAAPSVELLGTDVADCVAAAARGWRFPAGRQATRATLAWIAVRSADQAVRFERSDAPAVVVTGAATPSAVDTVQAAGNARSTGGLPKDVIMDVIKAHQREVRVCYEGALDRRPGLAGKLAVAWVIGPAGAVVDASVTEDSVQDPAVGRCVLERVRTWRFPAPEGGGNVNVSFPWLFKAAGRDD